MQPNYFFVAPNTSNVLRANPNGVICLQHALPLEMSPVQVPAPIFVLNRNPMQGNANLLIPNGNPMPQSITNMGSNLNIPNQPAFVPLFTQEPSLPPLRLPLVNNPGPNIPNLIVPPKKEMSSVGEVNGVRFNIQLEFSDGCTNVDSEKIQAQFHKALQNALNEYQDSELKKVNQQPQIPSSNNDVVMIDNDQFKHEYWRENNLSTSIRDSLIRATIKTLQSFQAGSFSALWQAKLEQNIQAVKCAIIDATERTIAARNLMSVDEPRRKRARLFARKQWAIILIREQFPKVCKDIAMSVFASHAELLNLVAIYLEVQFCHDLNFSQFKVKQSARKFLLTPSIRKSLVQDLQMLNPFKPSPNDLSEMDKVINEIKARIEQCLGQ